MIPLIVPGWQLVDTSPLTDGEVFAKIHTNETVHAEMEDGSFEFRIYRCQTRPTAFLLEYLSQTGKQVQFECSSDFKSVKKIPPVMSGKNNLEKTFQGALYRFSASTTAHYLSY